MGFLSRTRLLALGCAILAAPAVTRAVDLYRFTTLDSNAPANDDGYDPSVVSISADPNVLGPANGSDLAANNVGLSRFWNTEWAGFSASSGNGTTLDSATEFTTGYFQFTLTAAPGSRLNLVSLALNSARGGGDPATQVRGFKLYAAPNGQTPSFSDTPVLAVDNETGTRTAPAARSADLSGPAFQNISSVTFRYYPLSPATGNTMDFDGFTLAGTTTAVPEPALATLAATGAALLLTTRTTRRRNCKA
jgi:hypothetical protein